MSVRRRWIIPVCLALLGFVINVIVATSMAVTTDEPSHVAYGASILRGISDRSSRPDFDSKMPVSALNALPLGISKVLRDKGWFPKLADTLRDFRAARYPTILATFVLSLLVYLYAESLYGRAGGLLAQLLCMVSPTVVAHGTLATTDLYIALSTVLFLYTFRRFLLKPCLATAFLSAAALALAHLTKFEGLYLYLPLVLLAFRPGIKANQIGMFLGMHLICFVAIVNAGFLFDRTFTPLAKYNVHSVVFRRLQRIPLVREIPLPLPYPYLQGFDLMSHNNETGESIGNLVMLGHLRGRIYPRSDGFAAYYLVAYALKEPLGMQVLFVVSLWLLFRRRRPGEFLINEGLLLTTAAVFLVMLSLFSNVQIGIRHILPVLVIMTILSGGILANWPLTSTRRRVLPGVCLAWVFASVGSYFPHMIPYFNELVRDKTTAYRYLSDSNLHWEQDRWEAEKFISQHPGVNLDPPEPVTGKVLVNGNLIGGVLPRDHIYWLRLRSPKPIAQVGYGYFLFDVPPGQ